MNLSAENIGAIRELVRNGYPLKARDAKDLLGHNDHLVELLEARGRLMLGVEIDRDQLRAEVAGLKTGYEAYERVNAELKAEVEESASVIDKLAKILAGVVVALKGEELPLRRHSYHDLVECAAVLKLENDLRMADNEALRNLLLEASEEIDTWGAYASPYFQEKHDLAGCVAKFHSAAMGKGEQS